MGYFASINNSAGSRGSDYLDFSVQKHQGQIELLEQIAWKHATINAPFHLRDIMRLHQNTPQDLANPPIIDKVRQMSDTENSKIIADYETDVDQMLYEKSSNMMAEFERKLDKKAVSADEKSRIMEAKKLVLDKETKGEKNQIMLDLKGDLEQYSFIGVWNTVYPHVQMNMNAIVRSVHEQKPAEELRRALLQSKVGEVDRDVIALLHESQEVDTAALVKS